MIEEESLIDFFPFQINDKPKLISCCKKIVQSIAVCASLHIGTRFVLQKTFKSISAKDLLYLAEVPPSTLHAVLIGYISYLTIVKKQCYKNDVIHPYPKELDDAFSFSVGYSIHDCVVMYLHKERMSMYIHHFVMALGSFAMMMYRKSSFFPTFFMHTELTVPFQNAVFVTQKLAPTSRLVPLLIVLRFFAFLSLRTFSTPLLIWYCRKNNISLLKSARRVHPAVASLSAFNIAALTFLNTVWSAAVYRKTKSMMQLLVQLWRMKH